MAAAVDPSIVRPPVLDAMRRVAAEHKLALRPPDGDAPPLKIGLDSLGFAVLVARLEDELAIDPFAAADEIAVPGTVGDFIRFDEQALG